MTTPFTPEQRKAIQKLASNARLGSYVLHGADIDISDSYRVIECFSGSYEQIGAFFEKGDADFFIAIMKAWPSISATLEAQEKRIEELDKKIYFIDDSVRECHRVYHLDVDKLKADLALVVSEREIKKDEVEELTDLLSKSDHEIQSLKSRIEELELQRRDLEASATRMQEKIATMFEIQKRSGEREAKLLEVVKFYADEKNWREHDPSNRPGGMTYSYRITTRDGSDVGPEKYTFSGGKRAREALREMGIE